MRYIKPHLSAELRAQITPHKRRDIKLIVAGVIFSLLSLVVIFGWAALPSVVFALGINLLEVMIAVLQAYIFTLLSAIFIGQMYNPHH